VKENEEQEPEAIKNQADRCNNNVNVIVAIVGLCLEHSVPRRRMDCDSHNK
jgi:hypothetical protein